MANINPGFLSRKHLIINADTLITDIAISNNLFMNSSNFLTIEVFQDLETGPTPHFAVFTACKTISPNILSNAFIV